MPPPRSGADAARPHAVPARGSSRSRGASRRWSASSPSSASAPASLGLAVRHRDTTCLALVALVVLVGVGQALALEVDDGSISVGAVGALAGAALFGPRAALVARGRHVRRSTGAPRATRCTASSSTSARCRWPRSQPPASSRSASTAASASSSRSAPGSPRAWPTSPSTPACSASRSRSRGTSVVRGLARALRLARCRTRSSTASSAASWRSLRRGRACTRSPSSPCRCSSCARRRRPTSAHTRRAPQKLREAAETIQGQNVSLEKANRLLRERSTAAMESLSATVDARDAYTAGHSRRVQRARARDRPRARALAGRARPARPRGALPRHRQARGARRDPPEAGDAHGRRVGAHAAPRGGGGEDHRPSRLPARCRACDPASPRALRRHRLSGRPQGRGHPARRPDHPRRRRARLDAHDQDLPRRPARPRRRWRSSRARPAASSARAASPPSSACSRPSCSKSETARRELLAAVVARQRAARPLLQMDDFALSLLPWLDGPPASCSSPSTETLSPSFRLEFASAIATRTSSNSCRDPLGGWAGHRRCASSRPTRRPLCTRKR